jgi:hypothetical protein
MGFALFYDFAIALIGLLCMYKHMSSLFAVEWFCFIDQAGTQVY